MKKLSFILSFLGLLLVLFGIYLLYFRPRFPKDISYPYIGNINENMLVVSDGNKFGYYNLKNNHILLEYPIISQMKNEEKIDLSFLQYRDGLAPYTNKTKFGIIDSMGNIVLKAKYDSVNIFSEDCIFVLKDSKYYIIDSNEKEQINDKYDEIIRIENTPFFILTNASGKTLYDAKHNQVLFDYILDIQYFVSSDGKSYVITVTNELSIKNNYYYEFNAESLKELPGTENLYPVEIENSQIVFVNDSGPVVLYNLFSNSLNNIIGEYAGFGTFHSNLALVYDNQLNSGYVDSNEQLVIPYLYKDGTNFNNDGISIVSDGTNYGAIDTKNNIVIPFQHKYITFIDNNIYLVVDSKSLFSLYDLSSNKTISKAYDFIDYSTMNSKLLIVQKNKKIGLIDIKGNEIITPKYQDIIIEDQYVITKVKKSKYQIYRIDDLY